MNQSNRSKALSVGAAVMIAASLVALPLQAQAAATLPGLCDVVKNTACCVPGSLLEQLLAMFHISV